jgi:hypothetical protein
LTLRYLLRFKLNDAHQLFDKFTTLVGEQDALFPNPVLNRLTVVERLSGRHPPKGIDTVAGTSLDHLSDLSFELFESLSLSSLLGSNRFLD